MKRSLACWILLAALLLSGCGSGLFDAEYLVETTYEPVLSISAAERGDTTVATLDELKDVLLTMVAGGETTRRIVFDPTYAGDVSGDMASACWQVRTQDALCAYCVENIAYELSKIVNYYEAIVTVRYSEAADAVESIVRLPYAADAGELIRQTMAEGQAELILLSEFSSYSKEDMEDFVRHVYRETPAIVPQEPLVQVDLFSGAGNQRLYAFRFDYGMDAQTLAARQAELSALDFFSDAETSGLGEAERALLACETLITRCRFDGEAEDSVYAALTGPRAGSLGMAFAYVELCRQLGLNCMVIDGQYNRLDHSWNLIEIDGAYYHVDPAACSLYGLESGFLLNDETAWGPYRWDYFAYPHSSGTLSYADLAEAGVVSRENARRSNSRGGPPGFPS